MLNIRILPEKLKRQTRPVLITATENLFRHDFLTDG